MSAAEDSAVEDSVEECKHYEGMYVEGVKISVTLKVSNIRKPRSSEK